jgi:protein SCO1
MTRLYAGAAVAAIVALLGGTALYLAGATGRNAASDPLAACRGGQVAGSIGGPFALVNSEGAEVTDATLITRPTLMYFGYSYCPDVCPLDLTRNAEALDILEEQGIDAQGAFISVDPERDTVDVVGDYAAAHHPKIIGLTGSLDAVKAAAQQYKVVFRKGEDLGDGQYLVDHTAFTYLMLPGAGFADFFRREETADQMAGRVACFTEAAAGLN